MTPPCQVGTTPRGRAADSAGCGSVDRLRPIADLLEVDRFEQLPRETPPEPRWTRCCGAVDRREVSLRGGSVRRVMGMGGVDGPAAARRRRLIAGVLVLALILGAGAVVLSML
jgi:hypothetical protein